MSITLMHYFHTETSAVEDICPSVEHATLTIKDGLVEVETVEVECHGGDTKSSKPDTYTEPCCEEEVQRAGVVEGSVLEDETTEVAYVLQRCCRSLLLDQTCNRSFETQFQ